MWPFKRGFEDAQREDRQTVSAAALERNRRAVSVAMVKEGLGAMEQTHTPDEMAATLSGFIPDFIDDPARLSTLANVLGRKAHEMERERNA